ncbi:hypothetical protein FACS189451_04020 [Bacteroidia bacterium]|nr:hypothetical protein FACS189446_1820 [Bacteroidia bacterium]GHT61611.1 hypothetical protein FACS189451_04020 [Bacteroidia bacterium]
METGEKTIKKYQIHIRVSEKEKKLIHDKSNNYPSISALMMDAVRKFDDRGGANVIETITSWASDFQKFNVEISRIGNNVNQLAHYVNVMKKQGVYHESILESVTDTIEEYNSLLKELVLLQRQYTKKVITKKF